MVTIPGASGFLNSATLANQQGIGAQTTTVLGESAAGLSILDVARTSAFDNGIGLSPEARRLNAQLIESNSGTFNQIFSLSLGATATIEGLQQQILAIRAGLSDSQLAPNLRQDTGEVAASDTGQTVDTEA